MNTKIAPSRRTSSEALAAEQTSFKFFSQMCPWTARKSVERRAGCSKSPDQTPRSLADQRLSWYVARRVSPSADRSCHLPTMDETGTVDTCVGQDLTLWPHLYGDADFMFTSHASGVATPNFSRLVLLVFRSILRLNNTIQYTAKVSEAF